jgi:hypothetical protein
MRGSHLAVVNRRYQNAINASTERGGYKTKTPSWIL